MMSEGAVLSLFEEISVYVSLHTISGLCTRYVLEWERYSTFSDYSSLAELSLDTLFWELYRA